MNHEFQSATVKRKFGRVFLGGAQVDFSFRPTAEKAITYHQPATAARKGQKKLVMTIRTANPGEAFLQSPAFEEVFDDF